MEHSNRQEKLPTLEKCSVTSLESKNDISDDNDSSEIGDDECLEVCINMAS